MRYHLFQKFFGKIVIIKETSFLSCFVDSLTHTTVYNSEKFSKFKIMKIMKIFKILEVLSF